MELPVIDPVVRPTLRKRGVSIIGVFLLIQAFVAWLVIRHNRAAERQRILKRPDRYPFVAYEEVELERGDDHVKLYMHGEELIDDILAEIAKAESSVMIETFIWVDDDTGRLLRDAVNDAAQRGVTVYVMYDWVLSSRSLREGFFDPKIRFFPVKPMDFRIRSLHPTNLIRDHRKIVIIDNTTAFVGGYNFGDEYIAWRDTHVRITGRSVGDLHNAFSDFWNGHRPILSPAVDATVRRTWDPHITVHRNDPSLAIFPIRGMYIEAIDRAEESIWITTAYFVPDRAFRASLIDAARRGVDVRILLPARSNHPLTDTLAHGMFQDLLSAGIRIFLYKDFMVHAKTCVIDNQWSTIGTANIDRWSMLGNYEINVEIRSKAFAGRVCHMFELDLESAFEVQLDVWKRRPLSMRTSERVLRSIAPLL